MPIEWRDGLGVGNDLIDADHRHLLSLINVVEEQLTADRPCAELLAALDRLGDYTRFHFAREERIMLRLRYAKYDEHKHYHGLLIMELEEVAKSVGDAATDFPTTSGLAEEVRGKLAAMLRHWLVDHIFREDLKLKPLLAEHGRAFSAEP